MLVMSCYQEQQALRVASMMTERQLEPGEFAIKVGGGLVHCRGGFGLLGKCTSVYTCRYGLLFVLCSERPVF